jgi:hypothetical protein
MVGWGYLALPMLYNRDMLQDTHRPHPASSCQHPAASRGQSLVELLIGIAIGAVFIIGAATIIAPSLQIGKQTTAVQTKTELANELADNVKAWATGSWNNVLSLATGTANIYSLSTATSSFVVAGTSTTSGGTVTSYGGFSKAQPGVSGNETGSTTVSCAFGSNPSPGDTVVVASTWWDPNGVHASSTITSVKDGNGNTYVVSPNSPSAAAGLDDGATYIAYLLNAPSNASKTITITFGTVGTADIYCDDFSPTSGYTVSLDSDIAGTGNSTGDVISTPTVPVSGYSELLYSITVPNHSITAVNSPWLNGGGATPPTSPFADMAAYDASSSANTAVNFTVNLNGDYDSMGASFKATTSTTVNTAAFGNSALGTSGDGNQYMMFFKASSTPVANGTLTSVTWVDFGCSGLCSNNYLGVALYTDNSGSPGTLVASSTVTSTQSLITSNGYGTSTVAINASVTAGTQYWFAVVDATNPSFNQINYYYPSTAPNNTFYCGAPAAGACNPGGSVFPVTAPSGGGLFHENPYIYGTYTYPISGGGTTYSTSTEFVSIGGLTYARYFYLSDVYRDSNGNVTTTVSGNYYDPSTKLLTVVVNTLGTNPGPTSTVSFYLTRNGSNNFSQTSWAGGSGQSTPIALVSSTFYADSNIAISASGSIQLSTGGNSCVL